MAANLNRLFARYGWATEDPEPGIVRIRFCAETEEEFDLFALEEGGWLRLAITPILPRPEANERPRIDAALLEANALLTGLRFAVDADGDVALHGDLPVINLTYAQFAALLDQLVMLVNEVSRNRGVWP
ncbi:MAG: YbjN domain-containing protein [Caldilineaceae bacterium]